MKIDNKPIGILYICTGRYTVFWRDFYLSAEKYFLPEMTKKYFIFTDTEKIEFDDNPQVKILPMKNLGWPDNTLRRFANFLKYRDCYGDVDFLFFFNANALFVTSITSEGFLPTANQPLVFCKHPGQTGKDPKEFSYERRDSVAAYIPFGQGEHYVCGGVNGGFKDNYLQMAEELNNAILADDKNNLVAIWHDESHLNKYLVDHPNSVKILETTYCHPENKLGIDLANIIIRDKEKWGGHDFLRKRRFCLLRKIYRFIKSTVKEIIQ
jgi:hypothetical protein